MSKDLAIEIKDLVIDYGESIAVNNINLEIEKGELVTLLGPSGCGKSTTLNALAGLITTTSGKIYFNGKNVTNLSPKERKIGLVFQSYALYPHMTVYKNIAFPLEASKEFKQEIKDHNREIEFKVIEYLFSIKGDKSFDEKYKLIKSYEEKVKNLKEKIRDVNNRAKNNIKIAKELPSQTLVRKNGRIKSLSKKVLKQIEENESKAISLRDEILLIEKSNRKDTEKEKLISQINEIIQKTKDKNQEIYDSYEIKINAINSDYEKEIIQAKEEKSNLITKEKESRVIKLTKLKEELSNFISENKEAYTQALNEIKKYNKLETLSDDDSKKIASIKKEQWTYGNEIDKRVKAVAERVGITDQLSKKVTNLSGGQQQRVAISRTLVKNPDILLLDEPLSNLDAKMRVSTREWIRSLQQELGITTVFVTHDQEEAMSISDKVVCMSRGHIQQVEEPMEMYHNPANKFVAGFLGMPQMNFFKDGSEIHKQISSKNKIEDSIFGVRPEHLKVIKEVDATTLMSNVKIEGVITFTESFGRERLINVRIDKEYVKLFTEDTKLDIGDKVKIGIKKNKLYIFNNESSNELTGRL